jgi:hypothetical protein
MPRRSTSTVPAVVSAVATVVTPIIDTCSICADTVDDPWILPCRHGIFHRKCLERALTSSLTPGCPTCHEAWTERDMFWEEELAAELAAAAKATPIEAVIVEEEDGIAAFGESAPPSQEHPFDTMRASSPAMTEIMSELIYADESERSPSPQGSVHDEEEPHGGGGQEHAVHSLVPGSEPTGSKRLCPSGIDDGPRPSGIDGVLGRASGGCDARTLHNLGIFASEGAAKEALNKMTDVVLASSNCAPLGVTQTTSAFLSPPLKRAVFDSRMRKVKNGPRAAVGIDDTEWAIEVVQKVVKEAGYHFKKVQSLVGENELASVDLNATMKEGGAFFLDGYINTNGYYRGTKYERIKIAGGADNRERHSTAVLDYRLRDHAAFILGGEMSAANLWLDKRSTPKPKKGFLQQMIKAYKVFECSSKRKGCKGECGAISRAIAKKAHK